MAKNLALPISTFGTRRVHHVITMTERQSEFYLSSSNAQRHIVKAEIARQVDAISDKVGESVEVQTASGYPAWIDCT